MVLFIFIGIIGILQTRFIFVFLHRPGVRVAVFHFGFIAIEAEEQQLTCSSSKNLTNTRKHYVFMEIVLMFLSNFYLFMIMNVLWDGQAENIIFILLQTTFNGNVIVKQQYGLFLFIMCFWNKIFQKFLLERSLHFRKDFQLAIFLANLSWCFCFSF